MNSLINRSGLAAAALGALALVGCDSVKDVIDRPVYEPPATTAVLQGTITGLGTRRPIGLQYNGQDVCLDTAATDPSTVPRIECKFFGVLGQETSAFSFGSLPTGTAYNITVTTQPFAKVCTVANGTGTVGVAGAVPITIACANDPAVTRFSISGTIAAGASATQGLKVVLTTEEGVRQIDATGQTAFTFADVAFNSGFNLPVFGWKVTATVPATEEGAPVNNCNVTGGPVAGTGSNIEADGSALVPPAADVTGVSVTSCAFTVSVRADSATGGPTTLASGLAVALRHLRTGVETPPISIPSFGSAGARTFANVLSNSDAIYELVITSQPAGQVCVAGFGSGVTGTTATDAGAVLLLQPAAAAAAGSWLINRSLRCRAMPAEAARLRGVYQQFNVASPDPTPTRNFLAFFEDGTYLFGAHVSSGTTSGVEHGFYTYSSGAGTIALLPYTDTSGSGGLSNAAAAATLTNVVRTPGPNGRFTATLGTTNWVFIEPASIDAQMTGAWATLDRRRLWVYNGSTYNGFHAGVNSMGNAQDACFPIEDPVALTGYFTRRGNATTCSLASGTGTIFTLDIPNATTSPRLPLGFTGKWPQSGSNSDGRPSSPVNYTIVPGTPDRATIQNTTHDGTPVNPPIVLERIRAN